MDRFVTAAEAVGATVRRMQDVEEACAYIADLTEGTLLLPPQPSIDRSGLAAGLKERTAALVSFDKHQAEQAAAGVTGANFAISDTGTIALDSTDEAVRLATTLPAKHFVVLDPAKMLDDGTAAIEHVRTLHERNDRLYLAYITGPSRTADIERVLTIGVHGPKELHILLVDNLSSEFTES